MDRRNYAFGKSNFIWIAVSVAIVIVGFCLMLGHGTTEGTFEPDIFSVRRIKVAPIVCLLGFVSVIVGIIRKPGEDKQ